MSFDVVLNELYKDIILDHYQYPRNRGLLAERDGYSKGNNPLCGDEVEVSVKLENDHLHDIAFGGRGCAISMASASMMTELLKGEELQVSKQWIRNVKAMLTGRDGELDPDIDWGDLEALQGVKRLPVRIKCALLGWETLQEALAQAARASGREVDAADFVRSTEKGDGGRTAG